MGSNQRITMLSGNLALQREREDFIAAVVGSIKNLRDSNELCDVTLACEDETIEAHKFVLSANSLFFKEVFKKTQRVNPFIYLKGILHKDLLALLDYMYTGEAEVPSDDLSRVFQTANDLKISGLANEDDSIEGITMKCDFEESKADKDEALEPNEFLHVEEVPTTTVEVTEVKESVNDSSELDQSISLLIKHVQDINGVRKFKCKQCKEIFLTIDLIETHVEEHVEGMSEDEIANHISSVLIEETNNVNKKRFYPSHRRVRSVPSKLQTETPEQLQKLRDEISHKLMKVEDQNEGPLWQCIECDKQLKKKDKMESHIETHLEGFSHTCAQCGKVRKTRASLYAHISSAHK